MRLNEFKEFLKQEYDNTLYNSVINEQSKTTNEQIQEDSNPGDIQLDKVITISQQLANNTVKSFDFKVVQVWLKPNNMYTIVNLKKEAEQKNFWILFYVDGCYYLKKGIKGPIGVHCKIKD